MSENTFDPQEINLQFQPLPAFIDPDGSFKLNTPMLSSFNFDGSIPKYDGNIDAIDVKPGYLIQIEAGGQYYPVVSVEFDDPAIENTDLVTINYIDESGNTVSEEYGETDQVAVVYEDWSQKILGSQGWGITAEGNAIFTNVAVRGRIEATEGEISGNLIVNGGLLTSLTASTTGGIVLNNSGFTSYNTSGSQTFNIDADTGTVTIGGYATQSELNGKIDDGGAAGDIVSYNTKITGGNIETGRIRSTGYNGPGTGSAFSASGMQINLDDGSLAAPKFRIDRDGNAFFSGSVTGSNITGGTISGTTLSTATEGSTIFINTPVPGVLPSQIVFTTSNRSNKVFMSYSDLNGFELSMQPGGGSSSISLGGPVTATSFTGDGSGLTNIAAGNAYKNAITTPTPANKITFGTGDPPGSGRTTGDIHLRYT